MRRSRRDGNAREAQVLPQFEGVATRVLKGHIAADGGHSHELDVRVAVGEEQRERVIEPGVTIEQNLRGHGSTVPHSSTRDAP